MKWLDASDITALQTNDLQFEMAMTLGPVGRSPQYWIEQLVTNQQAPTGTLNHWTNPSPHAFVPYQDRYSCISVRFIPNRSQ